MKKVAEIYKSKVVAIHEVPDDFTVVFSPQSFRFAVDIAGLHPQPQPGWRYDFDTRKFKEQETVIPTPDPLEVEANDLALDDTDVAKALKIILKKLGVEFK